MLKPIAHLLLAPFLFITSCGYQLQPVMQFNDELQPIYVGGELQLSTALRRALKRQAIAITDSPSKAKSIVTLSNINTENRSYSLSSDGRNAELLVIAKATVQWRRKNASSSSTPSNSEDSTLVTATELSAESIRLLNPNQLNAQQQESTLVSDELRSALVEKVLNLMRYHQAK